MTKHLRMDMRVGDIRPISQFQLREGESLDERIRAEIETAAERGDLGKVDASPTKPAVIVYEVTENGEKIDGTSLGLYTMSGADVTDRRFRLSSEKGEDGSDAFLVETVIDNGEGEPVTNPLGIFFNEDIARRIGALWKAGVID